MTRLNFIFILIDDLGWSDLSCYGSGFYETPALDTLARQGVRFTDAYAACPVCSPTRASILTGRYPARMGVTDWIDNNKHIHPARGLLVDAPYIDHLPLSEKSLAKALGDGGYQTWHIGKWHLGNSDYFPEKHGFDVNIAGCEQGRPPQGYFSPYNISTLEDGPDGEYLSDRLTDEAIKLIRNRGDRPFFMNLCHYAVHTPLGAPQDLIEKYQAKAASLGLDKVKVFEDGEFFPCEHKKDQRVRRRLVQSDPIYAAMIENLDANIGRLLAALDEEGIAEETVVIFTSDNGGLATAEGSPTTNHPLIEGKGWMYDGGVREPLIVKWPGVIRPGSICDVPVTSPDFYPTLLEIAGLPKLPEQHVDGTSIVPLLRGEDAIDREAIFWHYPHYGNQGGTPGSSVRMGDYKLIEFFEDGRLELYNVREDMSEQQNLVELEPDRAEQMREILADWRNSIGAKLPQSNPGYEPNH